MGQRGNWPRLEQGECPTGDGPLDVLRAAEVALATPGQIRYRAYLCILKRWFTGHLRWHWQRLYALSIVGEMPVRCFFLGNRAGEHSAAAVNCVGIRVALAGDERRAQAIER